MKAVRLSRLAKDVITPQLASANAALAVIDQEIAELDVGTRPERLAVSAAELEVARVALATAQRQAETAKRLAEANTITREAMRDALDAVTAADAALKRAKANDVLLRAGALAERRAQVVARRKQQVAEITRLTALEKRHTVVAPFSAYVVAEHTDQGAWLNVGAPVVDLVALDVVRVRVPLLEDHVAGLQRGDRVAVHVAALPDRVLHGEVERVIARTTSPARAIPVDIKIANVTNEDGDVLLNPGMSARVTLAIGAKRDALVVPLDAIVLGGPSPLVVIVNEQGTAMPMPVRLGVMVDDAIVVHGALEAGMRVVTEGNERLFPGTPVRVMDR